MVPGIMLETSNPAADSLVQVLYVVHTVRIPEVVLTVYQVPTLVQGLSIIPTNGIILRKN